MLIPGSNSRRQGSTELCGSAGRFWHERVSTIWSALPTTSKAFVATSQNNPVVAGLCGRPQSTYYWCRHSSAGITAGVPPAGTQVSQRTDGTLDRVPDYHGKIIMADPKKIENAIRRVRNQKSFIQELLIDALGWDIDQRAEDVEDISFEWSAEELRANDLDKHVVDGTIRQIRPFKGNPWGIFILDFRNPDVFATGRGMTGTLRNVLRGLVPSKKKRSTLASFRNENLLFICNHDYKHYRFAHFKSPPRQEQPGQDRTAWPRSAGVRATRSARCASTT